MNQLKNLYVREDHILDLLPARLTDLIVGTSAGPGFDISDRDDPGALLRHHGLIITCTRTGWTLSPQDPPNQPSLTA